MPLKAVERQQAACGTRVVVMRTVHQLLQLRMREVWGELHSTHPAHGSTSRTRQTIVHQLEDPSIVYMHQEGSAGAVLR
jgi:hypothetical protein